MRKYAFDWSLLGDLEKGRPNLGDKIGLDTYRLMLFSLRDVLDQRFGDKETDSILFDAGKLAGTEFYRHHIQPVSSVDEFVSKTQEALRDNRIGILRIEEAELEGGKALLAIDEDVDCSGLPETNYEVCVYDEGFVSALFECFTQEEWTAKEIDCWCTGARTCRFLVENTRRKPIADT